MFTIPAELDTIDWAALGAPDIPQLVRETNTEDLHQSIGPFNKLYQILSPEYLEESYTQAIQLSQSEVQAHFVPILIRILSQETDPFYICGWLDLLESLARLWFLTEKFGASDPNKPVFVQWARRINDAVREGIPLYQSLLLNPNPKVQESAQWLLDVLEETKVS